MKRTIRALLALLLLAAPAAVQAQDIRDYNYVTNADGITITITGYTGSGDALIPSTINGLQVASIGEDAFAGYGALDSVTIPNSVTTIGDEAFAACSFLQSVVIGNSVTSIGDDAFASCTWLESVTIPISVTNIGDDAFTGCTDLTSATIPNSVTSIGDEAFAACTSLTSVTIPNSVTSIGQELFSACTSLTNVAIPNSVRSIEDGAFEDCNNLKGIYFQGNAPSLGSSFVFSGDNSAKVYYLPGTSGWSSTFGGLPTVMLNPPIQSGSLQVTIIPSAAVSAGAQWQVDGGSLQKSAATVSNLSVGNHTVSFSTISGWSTPNNETVSISNNLTTTASGSYVVQKTGSLIVTIIPSEAVIAGAQWQVDGGTLQNTGATVSNLSVGNHTVSFSTISGWTTPNNETVSISNNLTTTASGTYVVQETGSLQVTISPAAITNEVQWQVDYGTWQNSGATIMNLPVGNHTVSFNGIEYWSAPANQTVLIKANSVAKATGTYNFGAQGIYNGLFAQGETNVISSGMLSGLAVTASGTYSGLLLIGDSTNAISGGFNASGQASNNVARAAKQGGALSLQMQVNWNTSPLTIGGTVFGTNGAGWLANLTAELAASGEASAEYTALLLPVGPMPGYGYLLMTNHAGAVVLRGSLADGTSFSQSVPVSGEGDLPLYGNLYGSTGLLIGWIGLESGLPAGNLTWIKEASHFSALYTNGFTNPVVALQGSVWTNPLPHTAAIDLPSGELEIAGAGLLSPLTFNVAMSTNNTLVKLAGSPTNSLTGTNNPKTGLLTITFGNGAGKATTVGTGAFLQNVTSAGGFFLGKSNAGSILLQP